MYEVRKYVPYLPLLDLKVILGMSEVVRWN